MYSGELIIENDDYQGDFDLNLTITSGQTSQPPISCGENSFSELLLIDGCKVAVELEQSSLNNDVYVSYYSNDDVDERKILDKIYYLFDLDNDIEEIYDYLNENNELKDVYQFNTGLRLFKAQFPYECVISSISSANNSVARWTKSIAKIRELYGEKFSINNKNYYLFPNEEQFIKISDDEEGLKGCGVGYRSTYMLNTTQKILSEPNFHENIRKLSYKNAFDKVLELEGVGPKVADCILSYGYDKQEAYPVDVWINRITTYLYFRNQKVSNKKIMEFSQDKFGRYAGYIQLYLFNYARLSGLMDKLKSEK